MNEEELFCKLFPEYVVNGKPLSPYFDLFGSGCEQAENRIEELEESLGKMQKSTFDMIDKKNNRITELEKENAELKYKLNKIEKKCKFNFVDLLHDVENESKQEEQLTNAKELLKKMYHLHFEPCVTHKDLENRDKLFEEVKQFLNSEVEK